MDQLIAIILIGYGVWMFISPKNAFNFKAGIVKKWGVSMSATPRSYKIMKYAGLAAAIVGFLLYFG